MAPNPYEPPDTPYAAFAFDPQATVVGQGGGEGHAPGETTDLREKKRRAPLGSRRLRLASPMPGFLGFRAITNTLGNQRSKNGAGCPSFGPAGSHARASHRSPPRQMAANSRREHSHPTSAAIRGRVKVKLAENSRNECSQWELAARTWEAVGPGAFHLGKRRVDLVGAGRPLTGRHSHRCPAAIDGNGSAKEVPTKRRREREGCPSGGDVPVPSRPAPRRGRVGAAS
jgi:hypothetical protein